MKPSSFLASVREPVWLTLTILACLFIVLRPVFDYDLYWHVAYGREIAQSGHIIDYDVFSYTAPGGHFDNRYWLAQWLFFKLWSWFGGAGLLGLKLLVTALVAVLLFHSARHLGAGGGLAALTSILAVLVAVFRFAERPELFSLLFFSLVGFLLLGYQTGRLRAPWLWPIPLVMVLWDWTHGAVYGFGLLVAHVVVENLRRWLGLREGPSLRPLNLVFVTALVAMALNPWGLSTYGVFFGQVGQSRAQLDTILEYQAANWYAYKPFFVMLAWAALVSLLRFRREHMAQGAVTAALGVLGWRISRVTGSFGLACGPYLAGLLSPRPEEPLWKTRTVQASIALVLIFMVGYTVWLKFLVVSPQRFGWEVDDQYFPAGSVRFIKAEGVDGNLYNTGDIGGYLALELYPARRIFQYNHGDIFGNTGRYYAHPEELARWNITYAIVSSPLELSQLFPIGKWARIYRDAGAVVVVRRLPQYADLIRRFELRLFHPMMPLETYRAQALNALTAPTLIRETAVYLAYRRDERMARELVAALGYHPELRTAPDIAPYLAKALAFHVDVPGFAALVPAELAGPAKGA